jgi:CHAD domain-containing protein
MSGADIEPRLVPETVLPDAPPLEEPPPAFRLEFALTPEAAARLPRLKSLAAIRSGRARAAAIRIIWHDTPDHALAERGLALAEQRGRWQLRLLRPAEDAPFWCPGTPPPVLAEDASPDAFNLDLAERPIPSAAFEGRRTTIPLLRDGAAITLTLMTGQLRAVTQTRPAARLTLSGSAPVVCDLAQAMAGELDLQIPCNSLAAEALAAAHDAAPPPRRLGAPTLAPDLTVGDAFARVVGHLADVMLYWAAQIAAGTDGPEPVHQMRVALRRLRSALSVFGRAVASPERDAAKAGLKLLSAHLGPARDWDVFCAGAGAAIAREFAADRAVEKLLAAAERKRAESYVALRVCLASAEFRRIGIALVELAATRIWEDPTNPEQDARLRTPLQAFARHVLNRRLRTMLSDADDLADLPLDALHAVRLHGKRLRYAAEFFAPLHAGRDTRRFLRRLTALQERLGHLNDGAVAAALMAELAQPGVERAFAIGVVRGFVAAHDQGARALLERSFRKFRRQSAFWT